MESETVDPLRRRKSDPSFERGARNNRGENKFSRLRRTTSTPFDHIPTDRDESTRAQPHRAMGVGNLLTNTTLHPRRKEDRGIQVLHKGENSTAYADHEESLAIEAKDIWITFGTDGRTEKEILSAIIYGYKQFDCAESYNNIEAVQSATKAFRRREDYKIIYKFNLRAREDEKALTRRLEIVQEMFNKKFDSLLIHNTDGTDSDIETAWTVMKKLRKKGTVDEIGFGNIESKHAELITKLNSNDDINIIENSINSILTDEAIKDLISGTGARLIYYDVINTANEIGIKSTAGIKALIYYMSGVSNKSSIVLSTDKTTRQQENIDNFSLGPNDTNFDGDEQYGELDKIHKWSISSNACDTTDMQFSLSKNTKNSLEQLLKSDLNHLRKEIKKYSQSPNSKTDSIKNYLIEKEIFSESDLMDIKFPELKGLKRRYIGISLNTIILSLLSNKNCDWKWSIQLIQALLVSGQDWESLKPAFTEIVQN